ncbi:hypothetical protein JTE90_008411 [Oedothorax gibbosus]|uniref:Uncharacterized protein n=1 Tax=Oedothorax gibbosus TaxID=931172 RepID=A0AAV6V3A0_9ARAC|nr:hypothetical protein JTE90_008411 [Oedothorax gibbosus]
MLVMSQMNVTTNGMLGENPPTTRNFLAVSLDEVSERSERFPSRISPPTPRHLICSEINFLLQRKSRGGKGDIKATREITGDVLDSNRFPSRMSGHDPLLSVRQIFN